jgi:hypothetical protein
VNGDGDHRGHRAAAQNEDQHQRDDDLGHGAHDVRDAAEERDQARPFGQPACPQQRQEQTANRADQGRDGGDVDGFDKGREILGNQAGQVGAFLPRFGQHVGGVVADLVQTFPEAARVAVIGDVETRHHQHDEDQQRQPAIEPAPLHLRHVAGLDAVDAFRRAAE